MLDDSISNTSKTEISQILGGVRMGIRASASRASLSAAQFSSCSPAALHERAWGLATVGPLKFLRLP